MLEVSKSSDYAWRERPLSRWAVDDIALTAKMEAIHRRSRGTGALANNITGSGQDSFPASSTGQDFRLRQRQSTTVQLPGYAGANNDNATVVAFVQGNNDPVSTPSGLASNTVPTAGGFVGGAACPLP